MQRSDNDESRRVDLSDLTKSVGVSRELSERLTKVSESHATCRKPRRVEEARWAPDVLCS